MVTTKARVLRCKKSPKRKKTAQSGDFLRFYVYLRHVINELLNFRKLRSYKEIKGVTAIPEQARLPVAFRSSS